MSRGRSRPAPFPARFSPPSGLPPYRVILGDACSRAVAASATLDSRDAAKLDSDLARQWLTKAVAAGFRDRAQMIADDDLAVLRGRADFQRLLASITPEVAPVPCVAAPTAK